VGYLILAGIVFALFLMRRRWLPLALKNKAVTALTALSTLGVAAWFLLGGGPTPPTLQEVKYMDGLCAEAEACKNVKSNLCRSRKLKCSVGGTQCHFEPEGSGTAHRVRRESEASPGLPINWECWDGKKSPWDGDHYSFPLSDTIN